MGNRHGLSDLHGIDLTPARCALVFDAVGVHLYDSCQTHENGRSHLARIDLPIARPRLSQSLTGHFVHVLL
jgi:hypothetical protein